MEIAGVTEVGQLTALVRSRAQAEAGEWEAMVAYRDAELARIDAIASPLRRLAERAGVVLDIAQASGLSEAQVHTRLAVADRVRERAPHAWLAFQAGRIDAARVREISSTLDRLEREESWLRLDGSVIAYATGHTVAELRIWLKRFVLRVEEDLQRERAEKAREDRHVEVVHVEDSMAWLNAYLPSHVAAAIQKRLVREAKALGAADPRTKPQRMADLLASWTTTSESTETTLVADVAVTIEADVLTGLKNGFAASADGSWAVPASWILDEALTGTAFWHKILIDPISDDILAHQYVGRFAPELLAKAIQFRDGICRAPGCRIPAERCDLDHREPWPSGATTAENVWALCRRHHTLKGHRVLQWVLPSGHTAPAGAAEHRIRPTEASPAEHRLARTLVTRPRR
ncbi:DUF222 domain-containing protein [Aeromicrobium sp. CF4.19]|uniref:HNH endonuclease signature motif containing protein n=1 Tax=Aeromicrobium sp. CF4.19 TaxID=3373082 RepID=UPI003EE68D3D